MVVAGVIGGHVGGGLLVRFRHRLLHARHTLSALPLSMHHGVHALSLPVHHGVHALPAMLSSAHATHAAHAAGKRRGAASQGQESQYAGKITVHLLVLLKTGPGIPDPATTITKTA
jgi:hypothetical protein